MQDWRKFVREHLPPLGLSPAREHEIIEELAMQLEQSYADAIARGRNESDARDQAAKVISNWGALADEILRAERPIAAATTERVPANWKIESQEQFLRKRRGGNFMADLFQDLLYAFRVLRKNPGFTAIAILTIALGIGANTAIFSVVNSVLLHQVPFPHGDRLMMIHRFEGSSIPYMEFLDLQNQQQSFDAIAVYRRESYNITGAGDADRVSGRMVSADFFSILGMNPILGRTFTSTEDRLGSAPIVLLSNSFWRTKFAADPNVLTKTITLSGRNYAVIGILPDMPKYFSATDVFTSIGQWPEPAFRKRGAGFGAIGIGRLKSGVSQTQMNSEFARISADLGKTYPQEDTKLRFSAKTFRDNSVGDLKPILLLLFGAVGFVLLIACANVANLLLAKSGSRSREFATRLALGASRFRVIRQLLTETILLALLGGTLGVVLATWGIRTIVAVAPDQSLGTEPIAIDARVLIFALGVSIITGILFGLVPALRVSRTDLQKTLREGGRSATGKQQRTQGVLIVSEIALAMVLLVSAGLMIRSLVRVISVNPGFSPHNLLTFSIALSPEKAVSPAKTQLMYTNLVEGLRSLPSVTSAAVMLGNLPMTGDSDIFVWRQDRPKPNPIHSAPDALWYAVTPDYLTTMGITLERGRFISAQDTESSSPVVVIDEKMAHDLFPAEDPIGKQLHVAFFELDAQIVGVTADVKQFGLDVPASDDNALEIYLAMRQVPDRMMPLLAKNSSTVVRASVPPASLTDAIRQKVKAIDPDQVVYDEQTMDELVESTLGFRRFSMILMGVFAALALLLACVGIYGVISYLVEQRTHEIGVRMALGANPRDVLQLVLGRTIRLELIGVTLGILIALPLTKLYSKMLFGISAADPVTYVGVAIILAAVGLLACWIPAHRASRVDPLIALRYE